MPESCLGFILQPSYRIESGRPVVHLWGKLETGESFLVRDDRSRPHFFIRRADRLQAVEAGIQDFVESDRSTFAGEPVLRVEVPIPSEIPQLRDRLHQYGVRTFEADLRFAMRYLIDRGIRGSLSIRGSSRTSGEVVRRFDNPEVVAADWSPTLEVLSIDIETDPRAQRILSVGLHGCGTSEVILVSGGRGALPGFAREVESETQLLRRLVKRVAELDPDVLTGWNVVDFDFAILIQRAEELAVPLGLGRSPGAARYRAARSRRESSQVSIPGRLVLDGLQLLRGAFIRMERHSLDFVAREVLDEGKTLGGGDKAEQILHAFEYERERFVEYNLTDARLVLEILDKLKLVELAVERSRLTGLPLDRVSSSVAAFDFLYLEELGKRRIVAPSVLGLEDSPPAMMGGGHVIEPTPGLYEHVMVLDFKSLYPSLIRTFQIDPLGYVGDPSLGEDLIEAPNGARFRRQSGVLTQLLDELIPRRELAKAQGREVESFAIKILMNSFFGVLGTPVCRFYNPQVANAITSSGRQILLWSKDRLEEWGHKVLYGDTDSLFVVAGAHQVEGGEGLGRVLVGRLNRELDNHIATQWQLQSRLEIELEKVFLRLLLPPVRHGTAGARKRYAGLVKRGDELEVEFTGLEAVRRDWTELARRAQRELYRRLFLEEPVEDYLNELVSELRAGGLDDLLIYRKALRKDLDAYTSTTPPHVAAARKLLGPPGRLISYYMTVAGPEPVEALQNPIDYQHYLDKQLLPVAEPVLAQLNLKFSKVIGDDRQLDLF